MPPKKAKGASKKTEEKKKDKILEDKTFGLKNKNKSKNVQKYIQQVSHQVKGTSEKSMQAKVQDQKNKKIMKEAAEAEMRALFKAAVRQPDVPVGVDPKSLLCAFFKEGMCTKGDRCKYSHDLLIERKGAKIDLYTDTRKEKEADVMDDWDLDKLEEVIKVNNAGAKQTEIVCKYFLDAIEKSQYGWFWVCPNGGKECKYRHALPPGYVYKSKKERDLEKMQTKVTGVSIEELIEEERKKLKSGGTPVTAESLAKWKADKIARKAAETEEKRQAEAKKTGGKGLHVLSGRALFSYDPSLFKDDDDAAADESYERVGEEDDDDDENEAKSQSNNSERPLNSATPIGDVSIVLNQKLYLDDADDVNIDELDA